MNFRRMLASTLLLAFVAAPSMADDFNLGPLAVPSTTSFGNQFWSAGNYVDNYTFSISQAAAASGLIVELDPWWNLLDLNVTSVSLSGVGTFAATGPMNFGVLAAGSYTLSIAATVTREFFFSLGPVAYSGTLKLTSSSTAPRVTVPAPGVFLLFGLGVLGVAFAARRRTPQAARL